LYWQVRLWQALAVLASFVNPPLLKEGVKAVMDSRCFDSGGPQSVRQYIEGMVAGLLLKQVAKVLGVV
jgi:hypothetical protein